MKYHPHRISGAALRRSLDIRHRGHAGLADALPVGCPLLRVDRKWRFGAVRAAFDPERTFGLVTSLISKLR